MPTERKPFLKALHEKIFVKGQEAVAQEVATEYFEEQQLLTGRVAKAAAETLDLADRLATDDDPHRRRLANLIKDNVLGAVEQATVAKPAAERREPLEASPFSGGSNPSSLSLPSSPPLALPHEPTEPPKPRRGRPRKDPKN